MIQGTLISFIIVLLLTWPADYYKTLVNIYEGFLKDTWNKTEIKAVH